MVARSIQELKSLEVIQDVYVRDVVISYWYFSQSIPVNILKEVQRLQSQTLNLKLLFLVNYSHLYDPHGLVIAVSHSRLKLIILDHFELPMHVCVSIFISLIVISIVLLYLIIFFIWITVIIANDLALVLIALWRPWVSEATFILAQRGARLLAEVLLDLESFHNFFEALFSLVQSFFIGIHFGCLSDSFFHGLLWRIGYVHF